ncbi:MAG TPA: Gfo/Idh/MocA family oxidoreductase [Planctomycetota bacterium]|nr:Gfo/Idh/MocA family oxidoreductase [Planctomycetota bacterium]
MSDVGFAVVGLGMGHPRAQTIKKTPGASLRWVIDINAERAEAVGKELDCKWSANINRALKDSSVDVVLVMTPSGLHLPTAMKSIKAGKHTITTKPMEVTLKKCDKMIEAAEKAGVMLGVDFEERYKDTNQKIKFALEKGLFGKVILCEARLKWYRSQDYYDKGGWRGTWKMDGGGALANQTIHQIDLLRWFMGKPKSVIGLTGIFNHKIETEDLGQALIEFESGARGGILGTTTFPGNPYAGMEIHGTEGGVITTRPEPEWYFLEPFAARKEQLARQVVWKNTVENAVAAVREKAPLLCSGKDGRTAIELLETIYKSGRKGGRPVLMQ